MDDERFGRLLSRILDETLAPEELDELRDLARDRPDRLAELQAQFEAAGWIAQAEDELRDGALFMAATLSRIDGDRFVDEVREAIEGGGGGPRRRRLLRREAGRRWRWVSAAAAVVVTLVTALVVSRLAGEPKVVQITALNGSIQWTGDGGRVNAGLGIGHALNGGTLESQSAESWVALRFRDGTAVTVSGLSTLTIAETARKELHLRTGSLSAQVRPQPGGEPMVIHTPTAKLEVLGTQLDVDADASSTVLNVNQGRVRVTRLVDGKVAEVPAEHQLVASLDRFGDFGAKRRPEPVHSWRGDLARDTKYGQAEFNEVVRAVPYLVTCGRPEPLLVYLSAFSVASQATPSPVRLAPGGRLQVQGRLKSTADVVFGLTMLHLKGGFAGKFITTRRIEVNEAEGGRFHVEIPLEEFKPEEPKFPASPLGLELFDCWCLTLHHDVGLGITQIELALEAR
ncbi:MAG: FecR domain-containing protein [Isosphaeraceae bacterium]